MDWGIYSYAIRTDTRRKILKALKKSKTPTHISEEVDISVSNVSRTLKEFIDKGIVECLTPKLKMGRIYSLTKKGQEILAYYSESKER